MDSPMSPQKWQEYLAAFRTFQRSSATKYRHIPKDAKPKDDDGTQPAERQNAKASPVKPANGSPTVGFNTSMGASSTILTSPDSGKPVTNTAGTAPSTVSSKVTKRDESEKKGGSEQQVNGTSPNRAYKTSTHTLFTTGSSPPHSSFSKASTSRGPSESLNFSNSTKQPGTPDQLASKANNSVQSGQSVNMAQQNSSDDMGSGSSDVVVFRQDEHHRVGPRLYPHKNVDQSEKKSMPATAAPVNVPNEKTNAQRADEQTQDGKITQNQTNVHAPADKTDVKPLKKLTIEEKRAELHRIQQEELERLRRKRLGLDEDYIDPNLILAREGPGTDPNSEITRRIRKFALEAPKTTTPALPAPQANTQRRDATGMEIVAANSSLLVPINQAQASVERQENGEFHSVLVDWEYRPWQIYDDHWTRRFGDWLEFTLRLGCWVDTSSGPFTNPDLHPDGVHGFVKPKFEDPISILEEKHERAHETAAGYVHNWKMRVERQKAKELEDKRREIAHRKAYLQIKPEVHPYAPKTNIYLRSVEDKDIPRVTELYNWYVVNSVRCIELDEISQDAMKLRISESEAAGLPCVVAAEHKPGRGYGRNSEDELIYGFIIASEISGPRTANRYAAELELYVNPTQYNRRVGRSLLDKMLELCDPKYSAKRGYTYDNAGPKSGLYCGGTIKPLSRIIFIVNHSDEDASEYEWFKTWMGKEFDFTEQGLLKGTAVKQNKVLNSGYLVHNTLLKPESKGDKEIVEWRWR